MNKQLNRTRVVVSAIKKRGQGDVGVKLEGRLSELFAATTVIIEDLADVAGVSYIQVLDHIKETMSQVNDSIQSKTALRQQDGLQ